MNFPGNASVTAGDMMSYYLFFETLTWLNEEDFTAQPKLAESWVWSDDNLHLDMTLVSGATFFDGSPVDASAVKNENYYRMGEDGQPLPYPDIQAQILNLLVDLQEQFGISYLFIAHGMAVVKHISRRVGVMYLGKLVEIAPTEELFRCFAHPYTQALLSSIPEADPLRAKERIILEGEVPNPIDPPSGCRFHPRCRYACDRCRTEEPQPREWREGHMVACHFPAVFRSQEAPADGAHP